MTTVEINPATLAHVEEHHEHEPLPFWRKYIFSEDHKTIAKQYLISGIVWAILGISMSVVFRLQLGFPTLKLWFPWPR